MNRFNGLKCALWICFGLCLLILGCAKNRVSNSGITQDIDLVVSNQFRQIYLELRNKMGDSDHFPNSLSELQKPFVDTNLFVCHGTGSQAGNMTNIQEWTDFIYIGNHTEAVPDAPLVISTPDNHCGNCGYVLCVDGVILQLQPNIVRLLVKEPWRLATNAPPEILNYMKQRIAVNVPKRLRPFYPDPYNSSKGSGLEK